MSVVLKKKWFVGVVVALVVTAGIVVDLQAAEIFYIQRQDEPVDEGDDAQIEFLEGLGHTLDIWSNDSSKADPDGAFEAAEEADLVWINESVSSGRIKYFADVTTPIINNENYGCDTLGWGDIGREGEGHGSPGTVRDNIEDGIEILHGTHFGTDIEIVDDSHPIIQLAGLQNGIYTIYDDQGLGAEGGGRMSWCSPQEGTGSIVAVMPEFKESHPEASVISVYEAGEEMGDGRVAEGLRIGMFLSNTNRGPAPEDDPTGGQDGAGPGWEATLLSDEGFALLRGAIDYALGVVPDPWARLNDGSLTDDARVNYVHDVLNTWMGDSNKDLVFDSGDLVEVFTAGKFEVDADALWEEGDWNGDGRFNSADFVTAFVDGGYEAGPRPAAAQAVPEPSSVVLLLGALALCAFRRKRR